MVALIKKIKNDMILGKYFSFLVFICIVCFKQDIEFVQLWIF